jgi:aspartate 1-decarboxylase
MLVTVLKSKLAYIEITEANLFYEGSITVDEDWMDAAGISHNEQVHVVNVNNGARLITYAIRGERGSKVVCLNGPAARMGVVGDEVIIITYAQIDPKTETLEPIVVNFKA